MEALPSHEVYSNKHNMHRQQVTAQAFEMNWTNACVVTLVTMPLALLLHTVRRSIAWQAFPCSGSEGLPLHGVMQHVTCIVNDETPWYTVCVTYDHNKEIDISLKQAIISRPKAAKLLTIDEQLLCWVRVASRYGRESATMS